MNSKLLCVSAFLALVLPTLGMAELKPGTVVIYSDGDVEKLLHRERGWTLWEDQRKRTYKRAYLPYTPVLEYRRFSEQPDGYNHLFDDISLLELKPFSEAESVQFTTRRDSITGKGSDRTWQCAYHGQGRYKLGKKKYATEKYRCKRFSLKKFTTYILKEEIWFYYSPSLDLVLKKIRTNSSGEKTRVQVTRILKPEKATAKRIARQVYRQKKEG